MPECGPAQALKHRLLIDLSLGRPDVFAGKFELPLQDAGISRSRALGCGAIGLNAPSALGAIQNVSKPPDTPRCTTGQGASPLRHVSHVLPARTAPVRDGHLGR
jgi:hypothetical protein